MGLGKKAPIRQYPSRWADLARQCAELQSQLYIAGLYRTAKLMTPVVLEVGYEIAELRNPDLAAPHKKARDRE